MKKLFVSQPMKGKTDEFIKAEREKAIQKAKRIAGEDLEVIDSFFEGAPVDAKPMWYLGKSIQLLSEADIAIFCDGWSEARGCLIEHNCAEKYGISKIID